MSETALHPIIAELLHTKYNEDDRVSLNIQAYRSRFNDFVRTMSYTEAGPEYVRSLQIIPTDAQVPKFNIRIYQKNRAENKPVLVYFHGGYWIAGNLQTCDAICNAIAVDSDYVVISVDYALAPEYFYPTPLYQGLEIIDWINSHGINYGIDCHKIVVGGDNAGGNIAAGLVHLLEKKRRIKLFGQLLICPMLDYVFDSPSFNAFGKGFLVSKDFLHKSWNTYLGKSDNRFNEFACPRLASNVSHVPETLIFTGAFDPLQDQARFYAAYLERQGVPVNFHCFEGVTHNFWLMNGILDAAAKAHKKAIEFLIDLNKADDCSLTVENEFYK
jgi:acetyl esterase